MQQHPIKVTREQISQLDDNTTRYVQAMRTFFGLEMSATATKLGVSITDAFRLLGGRLILPALRAKPPVGYVYTDAKRADDLFQEIMTNPDTNADLQIAVGLAFRTPTQMKAGVVLDEQKTETEAV